MRDRAVFTGGTMDDTPTVEQALADLLALNDRCAVSLSGLMPTCDPTRCDQDPDHRPEKCLWCRARRAVASRRKVCSDQRRPPAAGVGGGGDPGRVRERGDGTYKLGRLAARARSAAGGVPRRYLAGSSDGRASGC